MSDETQTADESENTHEAPAIENSELTDLRNKIEELTTQLNRSMLEKSTPKAEPVNLAELYKTDPVKAIDLIAEQKVNAKAGLLTKEQQKVSYDSKAEAEFPHIKSDPEFQRLVKANIQEMVSSGEMDVTAPKLVYRAAQIAALKYKPKTSQKAPAGSSTSGEAPNVSTQNKKSAGDSQFEALASMFGIKNKDAMLDKWNRHKGVKK